MAKSTHANGQRSWSKVVAEKVDGGSLWERPPPGLAQCLIQQQDLIPNLRLMSRTWRCHIDEFVQHIVVQMNNMSHVDEFQCQLNVLHKTFPCIKSIECRDATMDCLSYIVGRFQGKSLHLGLVHCQKQNWEILRQLSKLESLSVSNCRTPVPHDLSGFLSLTTLTKLVFENVHMEVTEDVLPFLTNLEHLTFRETSLSTLNFLESLLGLVDLEVSGLPKDRLAPGSFSVLSALRNLTRLIARGTGFNDDDAQVLSHLVELGTLDLSGTKIGDLGMQSMCHLSKLKHLRLMWSDVKMPSLQEVTCLRSLNHFEFCMRNFEDVEAPFLSHLTNLTTLVFKSSQRDAGLMAIAHLRALKKLSIDMGITTDAAFTMLGHLRHLQTLEIHTSHCVDIVLEWGCFPELRNLWLDAGGWTDKSLLCLSQLKGLQSFVFTNGCATDACMQQLAELQDLTKLYFLSMVSISDQGLDWLSALTNLRELIVTTSSSPNLGKEKLCKALPSCKMYWR